MPSIAEHIANQPTRTLEPGETLLTKGESRGDIHVLLMGELAVERGGVTLANLSNPGTLVGEMSVLLRRPATATVRAVRETRIRSLIGAADTMAGDAELAMHIAALVAARLDATSSVVVDLSRDLAGMPNEQGVLTRLFTALHITPKAAVADERIDLFAADPSTWPRRSL
ncbi:MAG: cyclic nucleotide-binding domain-containing protein [Hyphomicrobiales bacterium]|nr:MAG: cyclic nucleotide-binding domain-containing protein [Hyphomicrobiales bacterium]